MIEPILQSNQFFIGTFQASRHLTAIGGGLHQAGYKLRSGRLPLVAQGSFIDAKGSFNVTKNSFNVTKGSFNVTKGSFNVTKDSFNVANESFNTQRGPSLSQRVPSTMQRGPSTSQRGPSMTQSDGVGRCMGHRGCPTMPFSGLRLVYDRQNPETCATDPPGAERLTQKGNESCPGYPLFKLACTTHGYSWFYSS
jgi:hypothetical protein